MSRAAVEDVLQHSRVEDADVLMVLLVVAFHANGAGAAELTEDQIIDDVLRVGPQIKPLLAGRRDPSGRRRISKALRRAMRRMTS